MSKLELVAHDRVDRFHVCSTDDNFDTWTTPKIAHLEIYNIWMLRFDGKQTWITYCPYCGEKL